MVKLSRTSWGLVSLSALLAVTFLAALAGVFFADGFALVAAARFVTGLVFEFIDMASWWSISVYDIALPKKRYKSFIRYDGIHQKSKRVDKMLSLDNMANSLRLSRKDLDALISQWGGVMRKTFCHT
jgi:hypothetical protein